ncbi:hypothetical protein HAPgp27 [Halomonas phage phiHAP-1]|uniref:Uncharacterized protein n=1 Tax=Halomonas phage phiHAP-1 (isolate -/Gulf of Mexico/-/2001) TaxID=1283337 RepID=B0ZSH5_BPHA1|nr:hypothetical protein HAPgp27 [Halomonas phage phiHAP-1]ABY90395.1 hypothetical protein HAPgp27 [Halomonas phage phiHAP-1]
MVSSNLLKMSGAVTISAKKSRPTKAAFVFLYVSVCIEKASQPMPGAYKSEKPPPPRRWGLSRHLRLRLRLSRYTAKRIARPSRAMMSIAASYILRSPVVTGRLSVHYWSHGADSY